MDTSKIYYFIGGLPRSGSTLLCNILCQNPRIYASSTSGLLQILLYIKRDWDNIEALKTLPFKESISLKKNVLLSVIDGYYKDINKPVILDKTRGILAHIEFIESILDKKTKVLTPVRDIREILAGFEKMVRKNKLSYLPQEKANPKAWRTLDGRCGIWMSSDYPIGYAYNNIKEALVRGLMDRIFFVEYEKLTAEPKKIITSIYKFLGEDYFDHDFDNIVQVTKENDAIYGMDGLHDIRPKMQSSEPSWPKILGSIGNKYKNYNI